MRRSIDAISVLSYDDLADYDVISDGPRSLESSIADLALADAPSPATRTMSRHEPYWEPPSAPVAREAFDTAALTPEEVQAYTERALGGRRDAEPGPVRVYVDGAFDPLSVRDVLRLRQAKLAFASAHVVAGVFADAVCAAHGAPSTAPCVARAELVRHVRWVDEVLADAPWAPDEAWLARWRLDYVAVDEGSSVDPACDRDRLRGFDLAKSLGKALPVRKTVFRIPSPKEAGAAQVGRAPPSQQGTIEGVPPGLRAAGAHSPDGVGQDVQGRDKDEQGEDPFEEPKLDEFGTGYGV